MTEFDIAISVGANCQCRWHISRTLWLRSHGGSDAGFLLGEHRTSGGDYGTHFFDWSITPTASLIKILESDFKDVFLRTNLSIEASAQESGLTVRDLHTGLSYPHTFDGSHAGTLTMPSLIAQYETAKSKMDYLIQKTRALLASDRRILFVLTGNAAPEKLRRAAALLGIGDKRALLFAPTTESGAAKAREIASEHILVRPIKNTPYPGDKHTWQRAFDGLELKPPA